jgi:hypothetical protein
MAYKFQRYLGSRWGHRRWYPYVERVAASVVQNPKVPLPSSKILVYGSSALTVRTRASCRCSPGVSGLACVDTAFTKYRAAVAHPRSPALSWQRGPG